MKSKSLYEIQNQMFSSLVDLSQTANALSLIATKHPFAREDRWGVYQSAYQIRLVNSVTEDFSRVEADCGGPQFEAMVLDFVLQTPSKTQNLAEYSQGFVKFIEEYFPEYLKAATLDWAEIKLENATEPSDSLSFWEIENEAKNEMKIPLPFKIQNHPASQIYKVHDKNILVFLSDDGIAIKEPDTYEVELFHFFNLARTQNEILNYMEKTGLDSNFQSQIISDWLSKKIIYCKKDLYEKESP